QSDASAAYTSMPGSGVYAGGYRAIVSGVGAGSPTAQANLTDYDSGHGTSYASFSPSLLSAGDSFTVRTRVENAGPASAGSVRTTFYAPTAASITTADYHLGDATVPALSALGYADVSWTGAFPNIPGGDYYIGWMIDSGNAQAESEEFDNTGVMAQRLTVTGPAADAGVYAGGGQQVAINGTFNALMVRVLDANGAPVANVPVTFTAPATGASATFCGSTSLTVRTDASGLASAIGFTANTVAGTYLVTATVPG